MVIFSQPLEKICCLVTQKYVCRQAIYIDYLDGGVVKPNREDGTNTPVCVCICVLIMC